MKPRKYRNKICYVFGNKFDSKKEALRYIELKEQENLKSISNLRLQVKYAIVVNNVKICTYIADFVYTDKKGTTIIEDVKGVRTPVYKLKKALMLATHGICILES
ncbi:uncharacterized protein DUF1064 [Chitinophaga skermanii]|uniref:Uncharacterized protein DUF1064 n=1 Tax=Chitinophaga skermanii TaxID=331697 RepID=A0A327QA11_9BACT|nr:DUF1064 domain-containing protein [Chitinophaga skermanii]RAJ00462.1 uncharacterized protein DUF1064 [Chitinophaga skermanii]